MSTTATPPPSDATAPSDATHRAATKRSRDTDSADGSDAASAPPAHDAAAGAAAGPPLFYVMVGKIPFEWAERDLEEFFRAYGTVYRARVHRHARSSKGNGRSKGSGEVAFLTNKDGDAAIYANDQQRSIAPARDGAGGRRARISDVGGVPLPCRAMTVVWSSRQDPATMTTFGLHHRAGDAMRRSM
jgi:RNA recognition motif-containing protein